MVRCKYEAFTTEIHILSGSLVQEVVSWNDQFECSCTVSDLQERCTVQLKAAFSEEVGITGKLTASMGNEELHDEDTLVPNNKPVISMTTEPSVARLTVD